MPVPSSLADISTTAASNSPAGADAVGTSLDDYLRTIQAIIKRENSKGSDITASTTIDVPADGSYFVVTGNTTIAGISDDWNGRLVVLKFSGTPQLTHSSGFILPGSANITVAAGDCLSVVNESTGVWRVVEYQRAAGYGLVSADIGTTVQAYAASASQVEMETGTEAALRAMSPLRVAQAIAALASSGTDQVARDQIALTNIRLMLNSAVTTGELVQGKQWELSTDEWGGTSTNEFYVSAAPSYYKPDVTYTKETGGSSLGNMTAGGGLAAAFDGTTSQVYSASAGANNTAAGYVGKDWGSGVTKSIAKVIAYGSSDKGIDWDDSTQSPAMTITLQGSTDNFSSSVVDLGADSFNDSNGIVRTFYPADTTAYRYHRLKIARDSGNTYAYLAELELYTASAPLNATLIPPAAVSASSAPTYMDAYLLWKDDSGSAVLGTDFTVELSRDNGTTYTAATLTNIASFDGTYSVIKARADVSAQPSGTSMLCRIKTLNNKAQRVAAPALYAE